jgi:hypothetical protein
MPDLPSKDPNQQSPKMGLRQSTICNRCGAQIPVAEAHWHKGVDYCDWCEEKRAEDKYSAHYMKLMRRYIDPSAGFLTRASLLCRLRMMPALSKLSDVFSWCSKR